MMNIATIMRASGLAAVDARVLMRTALGVDDAYLIAHSRDELSATQRETFHALAARRVAGEPVAYIVGAREFYGHTFAVSPAVLIPRPETELLVELALERNPQRVLDLGTGSGCIAISIALARRTAEVIALDRSQAALAVAHGNAQRLRVANVAFLLSDWFAAVHQQRFDVIVANPPYVAAGDAHLVQGDLRHEPPMALAAGADGLADIRVIIAGAPAHLASGGWLLFEHGFEQAPRCRELLAQAGFRDVQSWRDLASIERVSGGRAASL